MKVQKLDFDLFEQFRGNTIIIEGLVKEGYALDGLQINDSTKNNINFDGIDEENLDFDDPNFNLKNEVEGENDESDLDKIVF